MTHSPPAVRAARGAKKLLVLVVLAALSLLTMPAVAMAQDLGDLIDHGSVRVRLCPDGSLEKCTGDPSGWDQTPAEVPLYSALRVDMNWSAKSKVSEGDSFTVNLQKPFSAFGGTFPLRAGDASAGTCVGHPQDDGTSTVTCTFNDYVNDKDNVKGSLWFAVRPTTTSTSTETTFTIGGNPITVTAPSAVEVGDPVVRETRKSGWVNYPSGDREEAFFTWNISLNSEDLIPGGTTTITDNLEGTHGFMEDLLGLSVQYAPLGGDWNAAKTLDLSQVSYHPENQRKVVYTDNSGKQHRTYTTLVMSLPDLHQLGLVDNGVEYQYRIRYYSVPDDPTNVVPGSQFRNSATGKGVKVETAVSYNSVGGGDASGDQRGGLTIAKTVTGLPEGSTALEGKTFHVTAAYELDGQAVTKDIELTAGGEAKGLSDLPARTVVTLSEKDPGSLNGYVFAGAQFSALTLHDAIVISPDGHTATVTIQPGTLQLGLQNAYTVAGGFDVAKAVTGLDPGSTALAGKTFTVTATYEEGGELKSEKLTLVAGGEAKGLQGLPKGTEVTLSEATPDALEGYTFQGGSFTAGDGSTGVVISSDGKTATVTIAAGSQHVGLTNAYKKEVPPPPPTTPPVTPPVKTPPATTPPVTTPPATPSTSTTPPSTPSTSTTPVVTAHGKTPPTRTGITRLPRTGTEVGLTAAAAIGALGLGAILVGFSRRRRIARSER